MGLLTVVEASTAVFTPDSLACVVAQEQVVAGFRDDIMEQRAFTVRLMLRKGNRAPMRLAFR